jgi:hypothetical protein
MKKILLGLMMVGALACQSNKEKNLGLTPEAKATESNINLKKMQVAENQMGINPFTDVLSTKTWQEIDAFYTELPTKAQKEHISKEYLDIMQHNLICALVERTDFLNSNSEKIMYYAQEFERLGAEHIDVAGALYRKINNKVSENTFPLLSKAGAKTTPESFQETQKTIQGLRK